MIPTALALRIPVEPRVLNHRSMGIGLRPQPIYPQWHIATLKPQIIERKKMSSQNEKQRRKALAQAAENAREPCFDTQPGVDSWTDVLSELNGIVLPMLKARSEKIRRFPDLFREAALVLESGNMLQVPAEARDIASAEERLGITLPPSYTSFLSVSNGLLLPAYCKLASTNELSPYPSADPFGAKVLEESYGDVDEPGDEEYFNSGNTSFCIRASYAKTSIALNAPIPGGRVAAKEFGWILLVTRVVFPSGEFEVWEHGTWHDRRYRSFADYFSEARKSIVGSLSPF